MREGRITRKTKETSIDVRINLDGTGVYDISTGIGFLDHMLEQLSGVVLWIYMFEQRVICILIFIIPLKIQALQLERL